MYTHPVISILLLCSLADITPAAVQVASPAPEAPALHTATIAAADSPEATIDAPGHAAVADVIENSQGSPAVPDSVPVQESHASSPAANAAASPNSATIQPSPPAAAAVPVADTEASPAAPQLPASPQLPFVGREVSGDALPEDAAAGGSPEEENVGLSPSDASPTTSGATPAIATKISQGLAEAAFAAQMGTMVDNPIYDSPMTETAPLTGNSARDVSTSAVQNFEPLEGPLSAMGEITVGGDQGDEVTGEGTPGSVDSFVLAEAFAVADSLRPGSAQKVLLNLI